jgi:hypothetical protein
VPHYSEVRERGPLDRCNADSHVGRLVNVDHDVIDEPRQGPALVIDQGWIDECRAVVRKRGTFLITLDSQARTLKVRHFGPQMLAAFDNEYLETETKFLHMPHMQVAQVYVDSVDQLRRAYPNYDLDTTAFVRTIKAAIGG